MSKDGSRLSSLLDHGNRGIVTAETCLWSMVNHMIHLKPLLGLRKDVGRPVIS
jgi:hypothetical protein